MVPENAMESSGLPIREMKGLRGLVDPNGLKCLREEDTESWAPPKGDQTAVTAKF